MKRTITINRQFASGGREVGKRLADALKIAYYDEEITSKIASETHFSPDFIQKFEESVASRQFPLTFARTFSMPMMSPNDTIQIAENKIINELFKKSDCVFVGRCANYILKDEDTLDVFIYSTDMNKRIQRCYDKTPLDKNKTEKQMEKEILLVDKQRSKYHTYYTGEQWMNMSNYNLCIDTSKVDIKTAVELIVAALDKPVKNKCFINL